MNLTEASARLAILDECYQKGVRKAKELKNDETDIFYVRANDPRAHQLLLSMVNDRATMEKLALREDVSPERRQIAKDNISFFNGFLSQFD